MDENRKILGIIGGIGPLATVYFMNLVVKKTKADKDQDHIPMIVLNDTLIPDRTDFILDDKKPDPAVRMISDAKKLEENGADVIVMPCNTAHFFYDEISKEISVPMINIVDETVKYASENIPGIKKLGILATMGTVYSGSYRRCCDKYGLECVVPSEEDQKNLMTIIYGQVKAGKKADTKLLMKIIDNLENDGCDAVVMGCTELSVVNEDMNLNRKDIIDSMEVLAEKSILACGGRLN